jgi:hypothetical protein
MAIGIRHADHVAPSIRKKLALTSLTSGGRSIGIVRLRTGAMEFFWYGHKKKKKKTHNEETCVLTRKIQDRKKAGARKGDIRFRPGAKAGGPAVNNQPPGYTECWELFPQDKITSHQLLRREWTHL